MRDMSPDAQINYSLHSSILSCRVLFIEPVRCPLRMAWEEKCHSCQWEREESKLESQRKKHKTFDKF